MCYSMLISKENNAIKQSNFLNIILILPKIKFYKTHIVTVVFFTTKAVFTIGFGCCTKIMSV